ADAIGPLVGIFKIGLAFALALVLALGITISADTLTAVLYLTIFKLPRALLKWVAVLPLLTLPIAWFVFVRLPLPTNLALLVVEGFVVLFEAAFLYWQGRKVLPLWHAFFMSLVVNAASYGLGLVIVSWLQWELYQIRGW